MNPVTEAIENDSIATLKSLVKKGVDITKPIIIGEEYDLDDYDTIAPLFYAIRKYASLELIEFLLENGADIFETDSDGVSALDMAIKFKRKDVVKYCLEKGYDLNTTKRKSGIKPLMLACCFNDLEMIQMLLDNGADLNAYDNTGMSAKDYAKKLGQKKTLEFLEAKGARFKAYPNED